jgi:hypothetical protein
MDKVGNIKASNYGQEYYINQLITARNTKLTDYGQEYQLSWLSLRKSN